MLRLLTVAWILLCAVGVATAAEDLEFRAPATADSPATAAAMRSLAVRALPVYEGPNRVQFLTNLSALQMVAGEYAAANATRESLGEARRREKTDRPVDEGLIYDMYAKARATAAKSRMPFDQAFAQVFHETVVPLSNRNAYTVTQWLSTPLSVFRGNLQTALDRLRTKQRISPAEAVDLAWNYLSFEAFQRFAPLVGPLVAEDDRRRYIIDDDVVVTTADRARVSAVLIRPRSAAAPLPALLEFATPADALEDAKECAAHGYAGVVAYARGTGKSAGTPAPREHDGDDARAVIDWIAGQSWSDRRVGMYGSGHGAFVAWAAAKRPLPALRALAASSAEVPGIDAPAGEPVEGAGNAAHRRRLSKGDLERYWQRVMPYRKDFARLDVPVLTTTGYYDEDEAGSLYYFTQHGRYNPRANQTLLIGPYDNHAMERGALPVIGGYPIDPAAMIDLHELRYRWFDHVLKGAPNPQLLTGRVNFEVMGADEWRHAESLGAMANGAVRLYLDPARAGSHYGLTGHEPSGKRFVEQTIGYAEAPAASGATAAVMARTLAAGNGVVFVSGVLHRPLQVSGRISGQLAFAANRGGLTLDIGLYELLPSGEYFQVFAPPYVLCAGCARERSPRRPSGPGKPQHREFTSDRLTSVELHTGSRIVLVLDVHPLAQTEADPVAGRRARRSPAPRAPLQVRWYGDSFIELPVWR